MRLVQGLWIVERLGLSLGQACKQCVQDCYGAEYPSNEFHNSKQHFDPPPPISLHVFVYIASIQSGPLYAIPTNSICSLEYRWATQFSYLWQTILLVSLVSKFSDEGFPSAASTIILPAALRLQGYKWRGHDNSLLPYIYALLIYAATLGITGNPWPQ